MGPSSDILEDERDRAPGLRVALPALWRDATRQIATSGNRRGKTSDRGRPPCSFNLIPHTMTHMFSEPDDPCEWTGAQILLGEGLSREDTGPQERPEFVRIMNHRITSSRASDH